MNAVLHTMIELFALLVVGYFITKIKMIDQHTCKKMSALVVNVTLPALIIASVFKDRGDGDMKEVGMIFIAGVLVYATLPLIAFLCSKLIFARDGEKGTYQFMFIFTNSSFMGYPVLNAIFGPQAIFLSSIFNMPFNLIAFSYGIKLVCQDSKKEDGGGFEVKKLLNPGIIASILAMIIYAFDIRLPGTVVDICDLLGGVTTPLSMLILGISLADVPLKDVFMEWRVYPMTVIRLLILPFITYVALSLFTSDPMIIGIGTVTMAMPVASMTVMISNQYKGNIKLASVGVFISTLCSVVTIPLVSLLFNGVS